MRVMLPKSTISVSICSGLLAATAVLIARPAFADEVAISCREVWNYPLSTSPDLPYRRTTTYRIDVDKRTVLVEAATRPLTATVSAGFIEWSISLLGDYRLNRATLHISASKWSSDMRLQANMDGECIKVQNQI